MGMKAPLSTMAVMALAAAVVVSAYSDPRDINNGIEMLVDGYADQPYCAVYTLPNETTQRRWTCVVTVGSGKEGAQGEHMVSITSLDYGKTWSKPNVIEPSTLTSAYGVVAADSSSGRLFVVYNFNEHNVTHLPDGSPTTRTDELGEFVMRSSDDGGETWSERVDVPFPETSLDKNNTFGGKTKIFWTVDPMRTFNNGTSVVFAFTKIGAYPQGPPEELFFLASHDLLTSRDAKAATWELWPEADHGITPPGGNPNILEEGHIMQMQAGGFYAVGRTTQGYLACSNTADPTGKSGWVSEAKFAKHWNNTVHVPTAPMASSRNVKNPRGPITPKRMSNGMFLMLYYFNSFTTYLNRNPYWLVSGIEVDGEVLWSQPEIILYDRADASQRPGYPDFIEDPPGTIYMTETQKVEARLHALDSNLLAGLFSQHSVNALASGTPNVSFTSAQQRSSVPAPTFPLVNETSSAMQGLTLEVVVADHSTSLPGSLLLSTLDGQGRGMALSVGDDMSIGLWLNNGKANITVATDKECTSTLLESSDDNPVYFAAVTDAGAGVVTLMVNGMLCDGGVAEEQGWQWLPEGLDSVAGTSELTLGGEYDGVLVSGRVWTRALTTSELVGNYRYTMTQ